MPINQKIIFRSPTVLSFAVKYLTSLLSLNSLFAASIFIASNFCTHSLRAWGNVLHLKGRLPHQYSFAILSFLSMTTQKWGGFTLSNTLSLDANTKPTLTIYILSILPFPHILILLLNCPARPSKPFEPDIFLLFLNFTNLIFSTLWRAKCISLTNDIKCRIKTTKHYSYIKKRRKGDTNSFKLGFGHFPRCLWFGGLGWMLKYCPLIRNFSWSVKTDQ